MIALFLGLSLLITGLWILSGQLFFWNLIAKGTAMGLPKDHVYFQYLERQRHGLTIVSLWSSLFINVGIVFFGLRLSNRIAGPLYNLSQGLIEIKKHRRLRRPVTFRKGDYFMELSTQFNEAYTALGHEVSAEKAEIDEA